MVFGADRSEELFQFMDELGLEGVAQALQQQGFVLVPAHSLRRVAGVRRPTYLTTVIAEQVGDRAYAAFDDANDEDERWDMLKAVAIVEGR
tara:strand:+ start:5987 stop:6259 length:273 start_codon:yes stop_codon:yes gene_type:complete